jgi:hypothetical protein
MGYTKWTYELVKEYVGNLGYELVSKEFISFDNKIILKDNEGYFYYISFANIYKGCIPPKFHKANPYTIDNIKLWCSLNDKPFVLYSDKYSSSSEKLKWKCLKVNCGEIFYCALSSILGGIGCGVCHGKQLRESNCLAIKNPKLLDQWDYEKNNNLTPYDVTANSRTKVWWRCDKGHSWQSQVSHRNSSSGNCPHCKQQKEIKRIFANEYPDMAKEWCYSRNGDLTPDKVSSGSNISVWWKCLKNPEHIWKNSIRGRTRRGQNCPYCLGRKPSKEYNLFVLYSELCKQWNYDRNKKHPSEYCPKSNAKVWWVCNVCGHEWESKIQDRHKRGCPICGQTRGEKRVNDYLVSNKYEFLCEYSFSDLLSPLGFPLRYDFAVLKKNRIWRLIEYDGEGHYFPIYGDDEFKNRKLYDFIKTEYAKNKNIKLIRIPYFCLDKIEEFLQRELA